ncbi:carbohydrate diacid regulator [Pseudoduganella flava]|uniref:Carbohydrate diacid regulator n=1 Tax=Pseudoduganella flava TaxID=871742 RepID=A0A562PLF8_9BURK|nr:sugar diacid recognition domain-containing protein [Pseudoduganella flava]QGZ41040.1 transcriptional regulator [Pseudoduganella flava]TWI45264.1 carbohydrate diacid regulator [Pseudoduganella flava]
MDILTTGLARDIVDRTMRIIPFNVNVMDAHGTILASGTPSRIGELHAGALLALAKQVPVEIDAATARNMHGAKPGINLPLVVNGQVCGAVGLSGTPDEVRQFGALVRLTAEMILEQAALAGALQRDSRHREAFVLNLIRYDEATRGELAAWGQRLGLDFGRTQLVFLLQLDDGADALAEIQRLQLRLLARDGALLTAAAGPREMVLLASYDPASAPPPRRQGDLLAAMLRDECRQPHALAMGIALPGVDGAAISYQSAQAAARIGRARDPAARRFSYDELALPVLLSGLGAGWQARQLRQPMARLHAGDRKGLLRRTLDAWFAHDGNGGATAAALHIHRNTLDYRLRRIADITGLDLARTEDRFLLYVSALLETP